MVQNRTGAEASQGLRQGLRNHRCGADIASVVGVSHTWYTCMLIVCLKQITTPTLKNQEIVLKILISGFSLHQKMWLTMNSNWHKISAVRAKKGLPP